MPTLTVDGKTVEVPAGANVLQACEAAGAEIPRFCYHERLSIAGNCRMCLVEQEKAPKPVASCAMPAADGMVIKTNTPLVRKARRGVMEFLLINHPLDCPICDQGGECDLQDQAMAYGFDHSRYKENKRAVPEKNMGPLIKTTMTRCIQCTRCVRFATEVSGVEEIGAVGRGETMEITTYLNQAVTSNLSGNVIDLCPVGALTSKPYAFAARPWELKKTESIDVHDALGSAIRVDARGAGVLRILPRLNDEVNEEWISDKTRFAVDGLAKRRLDRPYVRVNGKLQPATWDEAFAAIGAALSTTPADKVAALAGDLADLESIKALKDLFEAIGAKSVDCRLDGAKLDASVRASYLFNSTIAGIEQADALLLIGTDPSTEAAVLNARIRKRYLRGGFKIAAIGRKVDLTYRAQWLGEGAEALEKLVAGEGFAEVLKAAKAPAIIIGQGALARADGAVILGLARKLAEATGVVAEGWNGFNVLHTAASRVGALDLGFVPGEGGLDAEAVIAGKADFVWLLGADGIDTTDLKAPFVVYQGSHGDAGAHVADVILPGAAYTEKSGTYVNTEGRVQRTRRAVFPPGDAREDWAIIRAFSERVGRKLPYDSLNQLRARIAEQVPHLGRLDEIAPAGWAPFGAEGGVEAAPFDYAVENFYLTNPIARASATMAECVAVKQEQACGCGHSHGATGTHG
ncbi:NADH-quinone oxidoreductase subunit NuoG [Zavarzinia compransoris]|uniref:NADH-quinone oxidoreductase n=1 Tax=Zavarzinia compransoris TaxID=1264899 RepID=A0A317E9R6_9PROT|nr:NADH-quinone oxidoreductase subunit NuoG [Zavarzinia compransoris]PWR23858.1 NADH-quinone oxidoreductase subunit G [Zavarzinia compransoris]TDP48096.1 NADH dehydrogenase subunit G [Zavarzinia compransoris]